MSPPETGSARTTASPNSAPTFAANGCTSQPVLLHDHGQEARAARVTDVEDLVEVVLVVRVRNVFLSRLDGGGVVRAQERESLEVRGVARQSLQEAEVAP